MPISQFFFFCHFWSTSLNTGILLWFFNSVLWSLLEHLINKILISSMTSLNFFNIHVCTCQFVCTCVEVRRQPLVFILPYIFCCCVYYPGSQAFWDSSVSASHLLHRSARITDGCYCTQLLHGSGHLKSGPHERMARILHPGHFLSYNSYSE